MSGIAKVENGEIIQSTGASSIANAKSNDSVSQDDFLQLLVAQMKYQDPMEPTENTEWVSQYAQFSQVEELQNMAASMELSRASTLVGQTVIMEVADSKGGSTQVQGTVDYVTYEGGKAYLNINGENYSMSDLSLVVDDTYLGNLQAATDFAEAISKLPDLSVLALSDKDAVDKAEELYKNLSEKSISMLGSDSKTTLDQYVERMKNLVAESEKEEA